MNRARLAVPFAVALAASTMAAPAAHAVVPGDVRPVDPSSKDDVFLVVAAQACPQMVPIPGQPPQAILTGHTENGGLDGGPSTSYEVHYFLHNPSDDPPVCPAAPLPPDPLLMPLGTLPAGTHYFHVIGHDWERWITVQVRDRPGESFSGPWYSRQQSGRGLLINRFTYPVEAGEATQYAVYWSTHDAEGNPSWLLAQGEFVDNRFEAEAFYTSGAAPAPGPADLELNAWGSLVLDYQGCGDLLLSWNANDPAIGEGSEPQVQLARPDGVTSCSPDGVTNSLEPVEWVTE